MRALHRLALAKNCGAIIESFTLETGLGIECAGVVVASPVGSRVRVGARVATAALVQGTYAQFVSAPDSAWVEIPELIGFEQAASVLEYGLTSLMVVEHLAHVKAGQSVLVHAAGGGVGQLVVQLARRAAASVWGLASTPEKRTLLNALGATALDNTEAEAWLEQLLDETMGRGARWFSILSAPRLLHPAFVLQQ